jgi:hypothetical protein
LNKKNWDGFKMTINSFKIFLFSLGVTLTIPLPLYAHGGEDHAPKGSPEQSTSPIDASRITLKGRIVEGVLIVCNKELIFYLADSATNQAVANAKIDAEFKGDTVVKTEGKSAKEKGSYKIPVNFKDGTKVHIELKVAASDFSEKLSIDVPQWPKASRRCQRDAHE